jgi:membrane-associated phospholipid phosphatase
MFKLNAVLTAAYFGSLAALFAAGRVPAVPWVFVPFLLVVSLPTAMALLAALVSIPERLGSDHPSIPVRLSLALCGIVVTASSRQAPVWLTAGALAIVVTMREWTRPKVLGLASACLALILGFATVWNSNYLLAIVTSGRLWDSHFVAFDSWMFSVMFGSTTYDNVFPLVRYGPLLAVLENSYFMLFAEVLLVTLLFVIRDRPGELARWLAVLFGTYAVGLLVFACMPVVGPHIYRPESFAVSYRMSSTFQTMHGMDTEYRAILAGSRLSGLGYFVAMPSLHVAVATLVLAAIRPTKYLHATILPVNLLLIGSTVLLGYHYLLDLPAGLVLGTAAGRVIRAGAHLPEKVGP